MFQFVPNDSRHGLPPARRERCLGLADTVLCLAVGAVCACWASPVMGQPKPTEFKATVLDLGQNFQRITVPLHRSVTIETTVEVTRADIIARQVADVQVLSPTRILITGQSFGNTSVVLLGADHKQYVFDVWVELDLDAFNETLRQIDPLSTVKARSVRGNMILSGSASSLDRAQRMVDLAKLFLPSGDTANPLAVQNHIEIAGEQQVLLRVCVAEVSRSASRELGINGYLVGENFKDGFALSQLGGINPINIGAAGAAQVTQNVPFFTDENGIPVAQNTTFSLGFPRVQTQLFLKAVADNNLMTILAEPNLVAISGETATFLAGGEFPVPVPQGDERTTIEWKEFGVRLNFTPIVKGQQRIRLRVTPEVSELDFSAAVQLSGFVVPGLISRGADSTIELGSGQTITMAGLLNEQVRGLASRIPALGDIPVLGTLFRSVEFQRAQSELVILVTPEIVAPLDAHQKVRIPGQDLEDPNDFDLYFLGLLDSRASLKRAEEQDTAAAPSETEKLSLHGPWGHEETSVSVR